MKLVFPFTIHTSVYDKVQQGLLQIQFNTGILMYSDMTSSIKYDQSIRVSDIYLTIYEL